MTTKMGAKIRELRKQRDMTLDDLAKESSMSKSYLWELENRESPKPSVEKLTALASALSVDIRFFLEDDVATPSDRHLDEVFFRNYNELEPDAKEQLRKILETFRNDK